MLNLGNTENKQNNNLGTTCGFFLTTRKRRKTRKTNTTYKRIAYAILT